MPSSTSAALIAKEYGMHQLYADLDGNEMLHYNPENVNDKWWGNENFKFAASYHVKDLVEEAVWKKNMEALETNSPEIFRITATQISKDLGIRYALVKKVWESGIEFDGAEVEGEHLAEWVASNGGNASLQKAFSKTLVLMRVVQSTLASSPNFRPVEVPASVAKPKPTDVSSSKDVNFFGYDKFDPNQSIFSTSVTNTFEAPIDKAFAIVRDFSATSPFWAKIFDSFLAYKPSGKPNGVGDTRKYLAGGKCNEEELLLVDMKEFRMVYGLTENVPELLRGAVTTIDLDAIEDEETPGQIRVTMSCAFQPKIPLPALVAQIKQGNRAAHAAIIGGLKKVFKPELGVLKFNVISGSFSGVRCDYMGARVSGGRTEWIDTSSNGTPHRGGEQLEFPIMTGEEQLSLLFFQRKWFAVDPLLGSCAVNVEDLPKTQGTIQVDVKNEDGRVVANCTLSAQMQWFSSPPVDTEEVIGSVALMVLEDLQGKVVDIAANIAGRDVTKPETWEYESYGEVFGPLPRYCKVLPAQNFFMPKRMGDLFQRANEYLYSQVPLLGLDAELKRMWSDPKAQEEDPALFQRLQRQFLGLLQDPFLSPFRLWMPKPEKVIENLKNAETADHELAAQLIRGVNPMNITRVKSKDDISQFPKELQSLTDPEGCTVEQLAECKSLFYCDYSTVMHGDYDENGGFYTHQASGPGGVGKLGPLKYWYAPYLVCYKRSDGKLDILGFTLTRFTDKPNTVYSKKTTPPNLYTLAKRHLTCADNQHHQFVSHLGLTHLSMEAFAVANNNAFPPTGSDRHPIGKLLAPHFEGNIAINFLARQSLVSTVAPVTDATFGPGTMNAMKMFSAAYQKWDFIKSNFEQALKSRGFDEKRSDDLEGFYYRDDGFKIWNALKDHFGAIVTSLYVNDVALASDKAIQGWCDEIRDPSRGNVPSFPKKFSHRSELVEALTTLVFYVSAQHAAVNFTQLRYASYVPNRPNALILPMIEPPSGKTDIEANMLYLAMPGQLSREFQTLFSYLLTGPPDNPFDTYDATGESFPQETANFKEALNRIHEEISERNEKLKAQGEVPYEYLDPVQVPQSINI